MGLCKILDIVLRGAGRKRKESDAIRFVLIAFLHFSFVLTHSFSFGLCAHVWIVSSLDPPRLRASRVPFRVRCNLRFGRLALYFFFTGGKEGGNDSPFWIIRRRRTGVQTGNTGKTTRWTREKPRRVVNNPERKMARDSYTYVVLTFNWTRKFIFLSIKLTW